MNGYKIMKQLLIKSFLIMIVLTTAGYAEETGNGELSGSDLWAQNCGRCHNYRGPQEFNDFEWAIIVSHMRVIGGIPAAQARAIKEFLQAANNPPIEPIVSTTTGAAPELGGAALTLDVNKGSVESGMALYQKNCSSCHGKSGKGDGPAAVSMRPSPRNLTDSAYMQNLSDEYLYKVISYGGSSVDKSPLMPAWGTALSQDQIIDVMAYLRSLSGTE